MRIEKIEINNFRGIRSATIDGFKRINIFIGKNNSCKTTILEAIFLNIGISVPLLSININRFRNLKHTEEDDFRFIFYNLNYQNFPKFKTFFDQKNHERTLEIKPRERLKSNGNLKKKQIENEIGDSVYDTQADNDVINGLTLNFSIKENQKREKSYKSEISFEMASITTNIPENYKEIVKGVYVSPYPQAPNIDKRLEKLIVNKSHKPIVDVLNKIDDSIRDISLGTNGMIYFDIGLDRLIPINLAGDGILRILSVLVAIADAKNGVIMIDEIDNGLYFSSLSTLFKALLESTRDNNVQIFATTHSYEALTKLRNVLDDEKYKDHRNDIKVYTIRKNDENVINSYAYDYEKLDFSIDQEIEIR